jgi:hypothetical protein
MWDGGWSLSAAVRPCEGTFNSARQKSCCVEFSHGDTVIAQVSIIICETKAGRQLWLAVLVTPS